MIARNWRGATLDFMLASVRLFLRSVQVKFPSVSQAMRRSATQVARFVSACVKLRRSIKRGNQHESARDKAEERPT